MKFKKIVLLSSLLLLGGCSSSNKDLADNPKSFNTELKSASKIDVAEKLNKEATTESTEQKNDPVIVEDKKENFKLTKDINSKTYILKDLTDNNILLEKEKNQVVSVASLTKIMTAHLLLKENSDVTSKVTMDPQVIADLQAEGASMAGFLPQDELTIEDLLYGTMLPSGGDAAVMSARYVSGTEEEFAKEMNAEAKRLNMKNTTFKNPTGLDEDGHKSTVEDLMILLEESLKNPDFYRVFTTLNKQGSPTKLNPGGYYYDSTMNKFDLSINDHNSILGSKTGFTGDANLCLASIIKIDNKEYALITTGAPVDIQGSHILDAVSVYSDLDNYLKE